MAEKRDYYEVLGVDRNVTADELKKAYRKMAIKYHPDRQQGKTDAEKKAAEEKFKEAAEAYDVLSNPEKRARYDKYGFAGEQGAGGFSGQGMSMDDIFSQFGDIFGGGGFGDFFGGFGGGSRHSGGGRRVQRGTDLRVRVRVTLNDVAHGVEKKLKIPRMVSCEACHGTGAKNGTALHTCPTCGGSGVEVRVQRTILGQMQTQSTCHTCNGSGKVIQERCPECGGTGLVRKEDIVTVNIPAGVGEGMTLKMSGKGNEAPGGGIPGDLLIVIEEVSDPQLQRDGNAHHQWPRPCHHPAWHSAWQGAALEGQGAAFARQLWHRRRAHQCHGLCAREPVQHREKGHRVAQGLAQREAQRVDQDPHLQPSTSHLRQLNIVGQYINCDIFTNFARESIAIFFCAPVGILYI